jgi:RNA polymerase primary sigma factor
VRTGAGSGRFFDGQEHEMSTTGPPRGAMDVERSLVRAAMAGDPRATDELVRALLPSIGAMARRYRGSTAIEPCELTQEGVVGVLRALERFDLDRGTPFWAYASWWVRQAMQQLVSELTRPVVLSDRALRQLARVKDARREHLQACRAEPSVDQLCDRTGLMRSQIEHLASVDRTPRALEEPLGCDDGSTATFGDQLADPRSEDPYERVVGQLAGEALRSLPAPLGERERAVVRARFGLDGPEETLREIAHRLGLSAERVRQIQESALDKLHEAALSGRAARPTSRPEDPRSEHDQAA